MAPTSELHRIGIVPVGRKVYELADGARHDYAFASPVSSSWAR